MLLLFPKQTFPPWPDSTRAELWASFLKRQAPPWTKFKTSSSGETTLPHSTQTLSMVASVDSLLVPWLMTMSGSTDLSLKRSKREALRLSPSWANLRPLQLRMPLAITCTTSGSERMAINGLLWLLSVTETLMVSPRVSCTPSPAESHLVDNGRSSMAFLSTNFPERRWTLLPRSCLKSARWP